MLPRHVRTRLKTIARALSSTIREPHSVLGLPRDSGREEIRRRYFELAKTMHPDTRAAADAAGDSSSGAGDSSADFVELHSAFESLMRSAGSSAPSSGKGSSSSAASTSARGGGGQWARKGSASARPFEPRTVSLAEVLAHRLEEEPHELDAVWSEIVSRRLEVDARAADALFRACARSSQQSGMPQALRLLREASAKGLLSGPNRSAALVSLLTWCKEDELDCTFELCDEVTEADRTPEVLAALSAAFAGCGGVGASF